METKDYRYFIHLAYNGKNFCGWQIQKNEPSIQAEINRALNIYFKQEINVVGCGRTDTGVHALNFYAHMDLSQLLSLPEIEKAVKGLNGILPPSVVIYHLIPVKPQAHTRYDAQFRTYQYHLIVGKDPFYPTMAYILFRPPDIEKMRLAAKHLMSITDFTSFAKLHSNVNNNLCNVIRARFDVRDREIIFTIKANRFLRNMVRAVVGTLLEVGFHKIEPDDVLRIAMEKDRSKAGPSVPPQGLFLTKIQYPKSIFDV